MSSPLSSLSSARSRSPSPAVSTSAAEAAPAPARSPSPPPNNDVQQTDKATEGMEGAAERAGDKPDVLDLTEETNGEGEGDKRENGWGKRRSPLPAQGGEFSSEWRSSGVGRERSPVNDAPRNRRVPPPPPPPLSIRPPDNALPNGAHLEPGTPPPHRTLHLYRIHIPQQLSKFGAALIGPRGQNQKNILRTARLLTFTIEPRFNRFADLVGVKGAILRGLKMIREMQADQRIPDEGQFKLDEKSLETWPGAWVDERFADPPNGPIGEDDERGSRFRNGGGRGDAARRGEVELDEFGRTRPAGRDRSRSRSPRRSSPPRRRHRSPSPPSSRNTSAPSTSSGTFPSSDPPPPHRTCLRFNLTFCMRKVGGVFVGPNGSILQRLKEEANLVSLDIRQTEARYAVALLSGSEGAIARALAIIEKTVYVEGWDAWNDWERSKLEPRGWLRFNRNMCVEERGVWLEERFSDPETGYDARTDRPLPEQFLPEMGRKGFQYADGYLPPPGWAPNGGAPPPQMREGWNSHRDGPLRGDGPVGGGAGGRPAPADRGWGDRAALPPPRGGDRDGRRRSPSYSGSSRGGAGGVGGAPGERWGSREDRDRDRFAPAGGSSRGGGGGGGRGGRDGRHDGYRNGDRDRSVKRGRSRSRTRSPARRRSPSPAGRSRSRSPPRRRRSPSPRRERERSRSRSRSRAASPVRMRERSASRERGAGGKGARVTREIPIPSSAAPRFLAPSTSAAYIEESTGASVVLESSRSGSTLVVDAPSEDAMRDAVEELERIVGRVEKGWKVGSAAAEGHEAKRRRVQGSSDRSPRSTNGY
ncbi:hypothetical protein JCM8097_006156 [Rhodosporidiobolus ruineniae]